MQPEPVLTSGRLPWRPLASPLPITVSSAVLTVSLEDVLPQNSEPGDPFHLRFAAPSPLFFGPSLAS